MRAGCVSDKLEQGRIMNLELRPEIEASLHQLAVARGVSVEEYLETLVTKELPVPPAIPSMPGDEQVQTGMVMENGILVYRTGKPLPRSLVDEAIQRSREERIAHILGERG